MLRHAERPAFLVNSRAETCQHHTGCPGGASGIEIYTGLPLFVESSFKKCFFSLLQFSQGIVEHESRMLCKARSEEHTSELQSRPHLVCRLLLEKKKKKQLAIANSV